jgi:hypothetical protein
MLTCAFSTYGKIELAEDFGMVLSYPDRDLIGG